MNNGQTPQSIDPMVTDISGSKAQTAVPGHDAGSVQILDKSIHSDDAGTAGESAT